MDQDPEAAAQSARQGHGGVIHAPDRPLRAPATGTTPVQALTLNGLDAGKLTQCFGVFQSEKDARKALMDIAGAQQLCLKILGLEI